MGKNEKPEQEKRPLGWTSVREAKRMLDAGVDPGTADMCYTINRDDAGGYRYNPVPVAVPWSSFSARDSYLPCWSLGAVMSMLVDGWSYGVMECAAKTLAFAEGHGNPDDERLAFRPDKKDLGGRAYSLLTEVLGDGFTVGDMAGLTGADLLERRGCGKKTICHIEDFLNSYGFTLNRD